MQDIHILRDEILKLIFSKIEDTVSIVDLSALIRESTHNHFTIVSTDYIEELTKRSEELTELQELLTLHPKE